jgi:hypothetical protein
MCVRFCWPFYIFVPKPKARQQQSTLRGGYNQSIKDPVRVEVPIRLKEPVRKGAQFKVHTRVMGLL